MVMEPLVIDQVPGASSALHVLICVSFLAWFSFKKGNNQWTYILFKGNSSKSEVATSFFSSPDPCSGAGRRPLRERGLLRVFSAAWPGVGRSGHPKSRKARFRWPGFLKAQREVCSKEPRGALKKHLQIGTALHAAKPLRRQSCSWMLGSFVAEGKPVPTQSGWLCFCLLQIAELVTS